jgi:hypothetical protein
MTKLFQSAALAAAATIGLLATGPAAASTAFGVSGPAALPLTVSSQAGTDTSVDSWEHSRHRNRHYRHHRSSRNYYGEPVRRDTRVWRGRDGRYYCRRSNGTTGLIIGAAGGALLGRGIDTRGERATGTILGAAAGALLGRSIDRNNSRCR